MALFPIFIGGFGNRLYQLANAFRLQDLYECDLVFHDVIPQNGDHNRFRFLIHKESDLDEFGGHVLIKKPGLPQSFVEIFPNLNWNLSITNLNEILKDKRIYFEHNVLEIEPDYDTALMGYFFNYQFIRDGILKVKKNLNSKIFEYVNSNYPDLNNNKILGIHLRLGISTDNTAAVNVPKELYENVIYDSKNNFDEIYVVSDNYDKAENFMSQFEIDKKVTFIKDEPMFVDMIILSKCSSLIIAPSTLSAWSAHLKEKQNQIYVPKIWFSHHNTNIAPNSWTII